MSFFVPLFFLRQNTTTYKHADNPNPYVLYNNSIDIIWFCNYTMFYIPGVANAYSIVYLPILFIFLPLNIDCSMPFESKNTAALLVFFVCMVHIWIWHDGKNTSITLQLWENFVQLIMACSVSIKIFYKVFQIFISLKSFYH